jgi:glyoxylase-like metal-dependent hydrolase (beta-lactamase superfamily II)
MNPLTLHSSSRIHTLDLNFLGIPGTIAVYLIRHPQGGILIECGPGSTLQNLRAALQQHGLTPKDITDVFLTHIHLDHAGAAGWLARQGARIHVHPVGAPHMIQPDKLLTSAARIYGDQMDALWGEFLPVPADKVIVVHDDETVEIDGVCIRALDTPGHANHHFAYIYENICFSGDVGGVRLPGPAHLRLPMPPPELNLEKWRASLERLRREYRAGNFSRIAPTHFGIYTNPDWHFTALFNSLDEIEAWVEAIMPSAPTLEKLNSEFLEWTEQRSLNQGITQELLKAYEAANPSWMSSQGLQRYWQKYRSNGESSR